MVKQLNCVNLAELCKMRINFKKYSVIWFRASSRSAGILYPPIFVDGVELTLIGASLSEPHTSR